MRGPVVKCAGHATPASAKTCAGALCTPPAPPPPPPPGLCCSAREQNSRAAPLASWPPHTCGSRRARGQESMAYAPVATVAEAAMTDASAAAASVSAKSTLRCRSVVSWPAAFASASAFFASVSLLALAACAALRVARSFLAPAATAFLSMAARSAIALATPEHPASCGVAHPPHQCPTPVTPHKRIRFTCSAHCGARRVHGGGRGWPRVRRLRRARPRSLVQATPGVDPCAHERVWDVCVCVCACVGG